MKTMLAKKKKGVARMAIPNHPIMVKTCVKRSNDPATCCHKEPTVGAAKVIKSKLLGGRPTVEDYSRLEPQAGAILHRATPPCTFRPSSGTSKD
jgi:hypothetical protein